MLATFGYDKVHVVQKPKIGIIATGSELLDVSEPLVPGKIRNSNSFMIEAQVRRSGAEPIYLGKLVDDLDECYEAVASALENVDFLITTGGVSVGDGHGGTLAQNDLQKDTGKHRQAGAHVSLVEGNNSLILTTEKQSLTLSQMISLYHVFDLDIIVVEGFKYEVYPKVVLLRSEEDVEILEKLVNVCCIVANFPIPQKHKNKYTLFSDVKPCITWLLTNKVGENIDRTNV